MAEESSPWMCHVCDFISTFGEGITCAECYKLTCRDHITTTTTLNKEAGLYEISQICVECQFKKKL